jgi:hypothetical protein
MGLFVKDSCRDISPTDLSSLQIQGSHFTNIGRVQEEEMR